MIEYQGEKIRDYLKENNISVQFLAEKIGVDRQTIYKYFKSESLNSKTVKKILTSLGVDSNDIFGKHPISNAKDLGEILDDEQGNTKFVEISPGRYRMGIELVPEHAKAGYLTNYADPEYLEELPKHYITIDKYVKGKYRAFEVSGDSMNDGTINSLPDGCIATGREIKRDLWLSRFHTHKYDNWIIVTREEGIVVKQIVNHDIKNGIITLHSINTDKKSYPDFDIHLDDVLQIYNVVKRELP